MIINQYDDKNPVDSIDSTRKALQQNLSRTFYEFNNTKYRQLGMPVNNGLPNKLGFHYHMTTEYQINQLIIIVKLNQFVE